MRVKYCLDNAFIKINQKETKPYFGFPRPWGKMVWGLIEKRQRKRREQELWSQEVQGGEVNVIKMVDMIRWSFLMLTKSSRKSNTWACQNFDIIDQPHRYSCIHHIQHYDSPILRWGEGQREYRPINALISINWFQMDARSSYVLSSRFSFFFKNQTESKQRRNDKHHVSYLLYTVFPRK